MACLDVSVRVMTGTNNGIRRTDGEVLSSSVGAASQNPWKASIEEEGGGALP